MYPRCCFPGREKKEGPSFFSLTAARLAFLAWGDFHARSRFARSTIPEGKGGTTRSLAYFGSGLADFSCLAYTSVTWSTRVTWPTCVAWLT